MAYAFSFTPKFLKYSDSCQYESYRRGDVNFNSITGLVVKQG